MSFRSRLCGSLGNIITVRLSPGVCHLLSVMDNAAFLAGVPLKFSRVSLTLQHE